MGEKDFRVRKGLIVDGTGTSSIAGSLGIGTTSPEGVLEIEQSSTTGHALKVYRNQTASNMDSSLVLLHDDSQYADEVTLHVKQDGTGYAAVFEGNVGIGDTTPSFPLEIRAASTFNTVNGHIMLTGDSATDGQGPQIVFSESGSGSSFAGAYIGHVRTGSNSTGDLVFATRATGGDATTVPTERMRILSDGTVGIGTTDPDALLHVDTGSNSGTAIIADGDIVVRRQSDNAEAIRLNAENDVSTHADILFHESAVIAAGNDMYFAIDSDGTTSDAFFQWRINGDQSDTGSAIMTLTEAGNLDVDGTVTATGFSGTVQPKSTVASAGNSTANYYAKLMTFDPDGNNHRDANAILAITTKDNGANASAIIHVKFRSNGASDAYTTDVSFISKSGNAIFNNNAFQIWSTGNGGGGNTEVMELWVQKNTSYTGLDVHELSLDKSGSCTVTYNTSTSWQSAAPTTTQQTTTQGIEMGLDVTVDGSLSATTKSFDIEHPTKEGMRLHHGSLEGPEHGVYHRGAGASSVVELPDYWTGLVDEDSITVQLTPKGSFQQLFVRKVEGNKVYVDVVDGGELSFYYNIYGTRKDVDKMEVEY